MDLRNLTFAINIQGDESKVVKTDRAMDNLVKTTGKTTKELASTSKGIENLGSSKNIHSVGKSKKSIEDYTKSLDDTQSKLKSISGGMKTLGNNLNKYVTLPLVAVATASIKMNQDLKKGLATISTLIPSQSERLQGLRKDIQKVSIDVAKGTDEIADATYGVISAYGDAEDTMEKVALNAKAATAGVASTADALNLSSAVMKGYGDTSAKANEKVLDLAFGTLKLGQTDFSSLANSIGQVVPLATELGIVQEDLFGVYAAATGVTGDANKVSTQYRGILQSLMAPTKEMTNLMSNMGYASGKAMIEGEGLGGTIQAIVDTSNNSNKPLKDYIGSIEGQTLALAMAGNLSEDYKEKTRQLMDSTGMMTEAFKEQTEGINASGFSFAQSMQRMKVAGQELGESMSPVISGLADGFSKVSEKLTTVSPETLQFIGKVGLLALALGPILKVGSMIVGGIGTAIGVISTVSGAIAVVTTGAVAATPAIATLAGVFTVLMGPVGMAIVLFGALTAAGVALYKNWDTVSQWAKDKGASIAKDWQTTKDNTVKAWNDMTQGISDSIGKIKEYAEGLKDFFRNPIKGTVEIARNVRDKYVAAKTEAAKVHNPKVSKVAKVDGNHATGAYNIPFNNYKANLHQDEMVLTAKAANEFRALGGTENSLPNNLDNRVTNINKNSTSHLNNDNRVTNTNNNSISNLSKDIISSISKNITSNLFKEQNTTHLNNDNRVANTKVITERPNNKSKESNITFNPIYNITLEGAATEKDKEDIEKVIDKKTRELFNVFFKEMNMQMA